MAVTDRTALENTPEPLTGPADPWTIWPMPNTHTTAMVLLTAAAAATVLGGQPTAPNWVRWAGLALALPAIALFIATAPRTGRR